jgi:glutathione S-transferase
MGLRRNPMPGASGCTNCSSPSPISSPKFTTAIIASSAYYEDQKAEAAKRSKELRETRLPKYLGYFDGILARSSGGWLAGKRLSTADLSLFHVVEGLRYAFPKAMRRLEKKHPHLAPLHDRVARRPRIAAYLASNRRQPFNTDGIFRHYPELDG